MNIYKVTYYSETTNSMMETFITASSDYFIDKAFNSDPMIHSYSIVLLGPAQ